MDETVIKRILPHSEEAEQAVIGSMLMSGTAIQTASEILTEDDFYQKQYGLVFDAMVSLYSEGKPVDLVTLRNRLQEKDAPARESRKGKHMTSGSGFYREQVIQAGNTSAYESWTAEEDAQLAEEFRRHKTPKEMSEIHHRTRGAILKRLQKLKLI